MTWSAEPAIDPTVIDEHPLPVAKSERVAFYLTGTLTGDGEFCLAMTTPALDGIQDKSRETTDGPRVELIVE